MSHIFSMKREHVAKNVVNSSIHEVVKLPFVQNKWISTKVWYKLLKQQNNTDSNINVNYFTMLLLSSYSLISRDLSIPKSRGHYSQNGKPTVGDKHHNVTVVLVREPSRMSQFS